MIHQVPFRHVPASVTPTLATPFVAPEVAEMIQRVERGQEISQRVWRSYNLWRLKLKLEGRTQEWIDTMVRQWNHGTTTWDKAISRSMWATGFTTTEDHRDWWLKRLPMMIADEREKWFDHIGARIQYLELLNRRPTLVNRHINGRRYRMEDWQHPDLHDDIAWVASRPCLLSTRQAVKQDQPLCEADFLGAPSMVARFLLDDAFKDPANFANKIMQTMASQWKSKKPDKLDNGGTKTTRNDSDRRAERKAREEAAAAEEHRRQMEAELDKLGIARVP